MNIVLATTEHVDLISPLFDLYRQFYTQPADPAKARLYIQARLEKAESTIFLALDDTGKAMGFTQLYATFCSVAAAPIWILYDLYVDQAYRRSGVGRALMNAARDMADASGAQRIELETAISNTTAQPLYEALGYVKNTEFYSYSLALKER